MRKFKIFSYGFCIGLFVSIAYSIYIYLKNTEWGDLSAIASFLVLFPLTVLITIIIQITYLFYKKRTPK